MFIIKDWAGNHLFVHKEFDHFDEAWSFINEQLEKHYGEDYDESFADDYQVIEVEGIE